MENLTDLGSNGLPYFNAEYYGDRREPDGDRVQSQLAGLLKAVTTAAEEGKDKDDMFESEMELDADAEDVPPFMMTRKRKRSEEVGSQIEMRERAPELAIADARAAGIHSAAAVFRSPSTKKNTRPSMSKLYTSLELTPESFFHLQAAAKRFMLDKDHPDRLNCVGSRGQGDTDMTKLKLHNCVTDFLENEGNGAAFFPESRALESGRQPKLVWPASKNKIVVAVTPLLRRMVTNERQRQYALETRKSEPKRKSNGRALSLEFDETIDPNIASTEFRHDDPASATKTLSKMQAICGLPDERWQILLGSVRYQISKAARRPLAQQPSSGVLDDLLKAYADISSWGAPSLESKHEAFKTILHEIWRCCSVISAFDLDHAVAGSDETDEVMLFVSLTSQGTTHPHFVVAAKSYAQLSKQLDVLEQHAQASGRKRKKKPIPMALLPKGMVKLDNEDAFEQMIETVRATSWMDNEVRITIDG